MGLLTPKNDKDKKGSKTQKNNPQPSKFIKGASKAAGGPKKPMTGGSQRGS